SPARSLALALAFFLIGWLLWRRGRAPGWASWMLLLSCWRTSGMEGAPGALFPGASLEEARSRPIAGRWRPAKDGRSGGVEPFPGGEVLPGHHLLFELDGPLPDPLTPVAILPGGEVSPWPRGPERPASSRARDFLALSQVLPDELVRLGPSPSPL